MSEETLIQETPEEVEVPAERPEWLPEKFSTPEDLGKAYSELSSKLGSKQEDIIKEYNDERFVNRPETVGGYEIPDTIDQEQATDNDLFKWWSNHAFENGFSQEQFKEGIDIYAKGIQDAIPQNDLEAESKKLGDNSNARIEAASLFANKFFPDELSSAIERLGETAEGIMVLEHIMESNKDTQVSSPASSASRVDEGSLQEMMKDERYWNNSKRDPYFVQQVEDGFKKLYG